VADKLATYRRRRSASRTPEPVPAEGPLPRGSGDTFVIQEHHARRLHWDLRLERDGVLVSWALPKGLPMDPKKNHLAVRTEDHPLEYAGFQGEIPEGEYGAGRVTIWDRGRYECEKWTDRLVKLVLHGRKVQGRYALIHARGDNWLIHRMDPPPPEQPEPRMADDHRPRPGPVPPDAAIANRTQDTPAPSARRYEPYSARILILSASMGGGHDGVSYELSRRLRQCGHRVEVRDYLAALPLGIGVALPFLYERQLRVAPCSYDRLYWGIARSRVLQWLGQWFACWANPRLRGWVRGVDLVIATYPLAAQAVGRLRRRGQAPCVIVFLTDFSVHPLWVAADADLHLALTEVTAAQLRAVDPTAVVRVGGALVREEFQGGSGWASVSELRRRYGIPEGRRAALLVAGSWGVGGVDRTARELAQAGVAVPVVVCGRNEALRARLARRGVGVPLGWVDDMANLMRACDVLIQNAGGLTSVEAFAVGLPVVSYRCLPGHGRTNAEAMAEAGVAVHACRYGPLTHVLEQLGPQGCARLTESASRLFVTDPASLINTSMSRPTAIGYPRSSRHAIAGTAVLAAVLVTGACAIALARRSRARIKLLAPAKPPGVAGRPGTVKSAAGLAHRRRSAGQVGPRASSARAPTS
jgi:DNA ligase D-like protein (predicted 3'-phosphoesterase)